jgi:hypothetical protein
MGARVVLAGYPRHGLLLENDGTVVGATLTIYSNVPADAGFAIRCNLSSWYVEPEFAATHHRSHPFAIPQ